MFEIIYSLFLIVLIAEVLVFLFLTLPSPKGWKAIVINFLNTSPSVQYIRKIHLGLCVITCLFLWDSYSSAAKYRENKQMAKAGDSVASQMKSNYFSYLTLKSQRNIYITTMLIYVSLALNAYVAILNYMYNKRSKHEASQSVAQKAKNAQIKTEA